MPSLHEAHLRHAAVYWITLKIAGDLYKEGGEHVVQALEIFDLEWNNIATAQAWTQTRADGDEAAGLYCCYYPDVGMHLLDLRQHPNDRIHWLNAALNAAREVNDREAEMRHLGNMGGAYFRLGELRHSINFLEESLIIAQELGVRQHISDALGDLGLAYFYLGEVSHAIKLYQQALKAKREIGNQRGEGILLSNIGNAYAAVGDSSRAIDCYIKPFCTESAEI
jgi:tetratricopeptide (TPR) repeat protein